MTPKDKDKPEKEKGDNKHSDKNSAPAPSVIKEEKEAPLSAVKIEKEEKEETEKEVEEEKDPLEVIRERTGIVVKTGAGFESRWSTTVLEEENLASAEPGMITRWDELVYFLARLFTYLVGGLKTSSIINQTRFKYVSAL